MTQKHRRKIFGLFLIISIFMMSIFLEGCEPLRKKFTRKKKKERFEETEIPVLEPIEYPARVYSPQEEYKRFFSLWRVWVKELSISLEDHSLKKRRVYLMTQAINSLAGMQSILPPAKQEELGKNIQKLQNMLRDFQSPVMTRNISSWHIELRSVEKAIGRDYTFSEIEKYLR